MLHFRTKASVLQISYKTGHLVLSSQDGVTVKSAFEAYKTVFFAKLTHVVGLDVSPLGNFLVTYQRPSGDKGEKNLKVWSLKDESAPVYEQPQKAASQDMWPLYQFDETETFMYRAVSNEVHALKCSAYGDGISTRLRVKGLDSFAISHGKFPKIAIYVPESKGAPGSVQVYEMSDFTSEKTGAAPQPCARRSFFRSSRAKLMWNASGNALLAWAFSDVDKTNQNYFGEQSLHYLSADGNLEQLVELKDGPIHDVKWSPNGQHFVAVHGFMPAKATLFDYKCKPIYDFGSGPRNTVQWSPFSRFLILGGFGNLPGDIEFYDKKADGKCKVMGKVRAACTVNCSWAPDGRHLITSTTSPRLRVDNGFKVFHYNGDLVHEEKVDVLLEVEFGPSPPGVFEDRPASPGKIGKNQKGGSGQNAGRPAAYVPPHLKNAKNKGQPSSNFSLAYDKKEDSPGKIKFQVSQRSSNLPPGAELATSKAASKNAKRRQRKKAAQAAGEGGGTNAGSNQEVKEEVAKVSKALEEKAAVQVAADAPKRIRNLEKKLRQIEQIKAKPADALTPEQLKKLESEPQIRKEIESLRKECQ